MRMIFPSRRSCSRSIFGDVWDVVLYRRDRSILVLHRIDKITEEGFFMVGDNQWEIEGPLRSDQIIGKLVAFVRNGREISAQNPFYRFLSSVWLL